MAFLGMVFVCCVLLVSGLPPLPGFLAKFALLSTVLQSAAADGAPISTWVLCGAIVLSGFASLIALSRIGMRLFWSAGRAHDTAVAATRSDAGCGDGPAVRRARRRG